MPRGEMFARWSVVLLVVLCLCPVPGWYTLCGSQPRERHGCAWREHERRWRGQRGIPCANLPLAPLCAVLCVCISTNLMLVGIGGCLSHARHTLTRREHGRGRRRERPHCSPRGVRWWWWWLLRLSSTIWLFVWRILLVWVLLWYFLRGNGRGCTCRGEHGRGRERVRVPSLLRTLILGDVPFRHSRRGCMRCEHGRGRERCCVPLVRSPHTLLVWPVLSTHPTRRVRGKHGRGRHGCLGPVRAPWHNRLPRVRVRREHGWGWEGSFTPTRILCVPLRCNPLTCRGCGCGVRREHWRGREVGMRPTRPLCMPMLRF